MPADHSLAAEPILLIDRWQLAEPLPMRPVLSTGQVSEIFIDGGQFVIIHSSERTPWHLLAEFMAVGIDAGAYGGDEFRKLLVLDEIEVRSERSHLPRHAAG
jgi:hypothetical protein